METELKFSSFLSETFIGRKKKSEGIKEETKNSIRENSTPQALCNNLYGNISLA